MNNIKQYIKSSEGSLRTYLEDVQFFARRLRELDRIKRRVDSGSVRELQKLQDLRTVNAMLTQHEILSERLSSYTMSLDMRHDIEELLDNVIDDLRYLLDKLETKKPISSLCSGLYLDHQRFINDFEAKDAFDLTLEDIEKFYRSYGYKVPVCFMSYSWLLGEYIPSSNILYPTDNEERCTKEMLLHIRNDLYKAGAHVYFDVTDIQDTPPIDFMKTLEYSDIVLLFGVESLFDRNRRDVSRIYNRMMMEGKRVLPIMLSGDYNSDFSKMFQFQIVIADWSKEGYVSGIKNLVRLLYGASRSNMDYNNLWSEFERNYREYI
jgi:hypothetical protein